MRPQARLLRTYGVVVLTWLLFHGAATWLGSTRGERGALVAGLVLLSLALLDPGLRPGLAAAFRRPPARSMVLALLLGAALLAYLPLFAWRTGARLSLRPGWPLLLPGLLAQAGVAEEALYRVALFGRLRGGRSFWRAAWLSLPPFVVAHLPLFRDLSPAIAAGALLLAFAMSFPLARLYELGRGTLWAAALVHAVAQGAIKLVEAPPEHAGALALGWMAACLAVPWLLFLPRCERLVHR